MHKHIYTFFLIASLVASILIIVSGRSFYHDAYPTMETTQLRVGTIQIAATNQTELRELSFHVIVDIPTKLVEIFWQWYPLSNGSVEFAAILPFQISSFNLSLFPENGILAFYNVPGNGSIVTDTLNQTVNTRSIDLSTQAVVYMNTADSLVSGGRGNYVFYIPFGQQIPQGLAQKLQNLSNPYSPVSIISGNYPTTLSVGLSKDASVNLIYPPTALPLQFSSPGSINFRYYYWNFSMAQPVIMDYQIGTVVTTYDQDLFWGGMLLSLGFSTLAATLFEMVKTLRDSTTKKGSNP